MNRTIFIIFILGVITTPRSLSNYPILNPFAVRIPGCFIVIRRFCSTSSISLNHIISYLLVHWTMKYIKSGPTLYCVTFYTYFTGKKTHTSCYFQLLYSFVFTTSLQLFERLIWRLKVFFFRFFGKCILFGRFSSVKVNLSTYSRSMFVV